MLKEIKERRRAPRFNLQAEVRYLLYNKIEGGGKLLNISEYGLALLAEHEAVIGNDVVLYPDGVGRIVGRVVRAFEGGFAVTFAVSDSQRKTIKKRIQSAMKGMPYLRLAENRSTVRKECNIETQVRLRHRDRLIPCTVMDLSQAGCRVQCRDRPAIGSFAAIGLLHGIVVRHCEDGFALEFCHPDEGKDRERKRKQEVEKSTRRSVRMGFRGGVTNTR